MRAAWIAALLIGCAPAPPERLPRMPRRQAPVANTRVDEPPPPPARRSRWLELELDGENWRERVADIPPERRMWMAKSFLREGNFACSPIQYQPVGSCSLRAAVPRAEPTATIEDPCLRREIAMWAIDQLDEDAVHELYDAFVEIVQIPPPEQALTHAALARFQTGWTAASMQWEAKAAGHKDLPTLSLAHAFDHDELRRSATELHYDAAVLTLEAAQDLDVYLEGLSDHELMLSTRLEVLRRLIEIFPSATQREADMIRGALRTRTYNADCTEAAAASAALAEIGDGTIELPAGPFREAEALIHATCVTLASGTRGAPWKQVVSKHGLAITSERTDPFRVDALWTQYPFAYDRDLDGAPDVPDADPDGDGDVATTRESRTARWTKKFTLPFADELKLALPHCEGVVCRVPDTTVWFELDIAKERGTKLRLRGVERHEKIGSDC